MRRPLLFLDVDGPLIPFGGPDPHPTFGRTPAGSNPLLSRIDPAHGPRLASLSCDIVWATTWMADANRHVCPLLGLPELPVVSWPESPDELDNWYGLHWKTRTIVDWAAGHPFAWFDDEVTDADRDWVARHHATRALLHRVDARRGLMDDDYATLTRWISASR
jgi:hypothetical protein